MTRVTRETSTTRELYDELDRIFAARDRDDMAPTIAALLPLHDEHPHDARVLYELAGAYDTAGDEERALGLYEQATAEGLEGDLRRRCYLQHGSTLRNVGRVEDSLALFTQARAEFPESAALGVFESLSLHAAGRPSTALASVLLLLADHVESEDLDRYKPAVRGNAEYLASLDEASSAAAL
jgi:tetratricopeptide (TPR) repeat protein